MATRRLSLGLSGNTQSVGGIVKNIDTGELVWKGSVNLSEEVAPAFGVRDSFVADGAGGWFWIPALYAAALERSFEKMLEIIGRDAVGEIVCIAGGFHQHARFDTNGRAECTLSQVGSTQPLAPQVAPMFTQPVFPSWMHAGAVEQCRAMAREMDGGAEAIARITGSWPTARFPAAPIRHLWETNPAVYKAIGARSMHSGSSLFPSILTGRLSGVDITEASAWNLMNLRTGKWSPAVCSVVAPGLVRKLPQILPRLSSVGVVSPFFRQKFGFSHLCGVYSFTGDNIATLLGVGVTAPGTVVLSLGTSWTLLDIVLKAVHDANRLGHTMVAWTEGFMRMICQTNGGMSMRDFRNELSLGPTWETFDDILAEATIDPAAYVLPFRYDEGLGNRSRSITYVGMEKGHVRKVVPGVVAGLFANLALSAGFIGDLRGKTIIATGGGSVSRAVLQWAADVLQATVIPSLTQDTVALGGAMGAAIAYLGNEGSAVIAERFHEHGAPIPPRPGSGGARDKLLAAFRQSVRR